MYLYVLLNVFINTSSTLSTLSTWDKDTVQVHVTLGKKYLKYWEGLYLLYLSTSTNVL